ncbi:hypothetical protein ACO0LC_01070 [Undibacterium sp. JH2W]|uniref:hypothetical protein n=1 Tax=Undibacterium sp. JH2W TaxID=3413037 RepID=UPI003BEFCC01
MVFLALTRNGLDELIALRKTTDIAIWCGSNVLSNAEYAALSGMNISRFNYPLKSPGDEAFQGALETMADHHGNEKIWVENIN